jgi:hypothetical protein
VPPHHIILELIRRALFQETDWTAREVDITGRLLGPNPLPVSIMLPALGSAAKNDLPDREQDYNDQARIKPKSKGVCASKISGGFVFGIDANFAIP